MVSNEIITCPFCGKDYPFSTELKPKNSYAFINKGNGNRYYFNNDISSSNDLSLRKFDNPNIYEITITRCPHCFEERIIIKHGNLEEEEKFVEFSDPSLKTMIRPKSAHKVFPDYVPRAIREDYEEACSILELSPKAAATLARRALEGMILDFWTIPSKAKGNLKAEIAELQGKIPQNQWKAIDALRNLGNIGAHMEKDTSTIVDIDPGEAEKLLMLIEHLVEQWYIARHDEEELYNNIVGISTEKENERKKAGNTPAQS